MDDEDEEMKEVKKLSKEELEINVKEDIDQWVTKNSLNSRLELSLELES